MTKSILTTLSLSFFTLAAAVPSPASAQSGPMPLASAPIESTRPGCSMQAEIDLGWERLQQVVEARMAARSSEVLKVPGAVISPPFPAFAPYRTDVPSASVAGKTPKASNHGSRARGAVSTKS